MGLLDASTGEMELVNDFEKHEELHNMEEDILEIILMQENSDKIGMALKRIDPVYRMIITRHVIGEVTLKEISKTRKWKNKF